jgi:hypothetical protein
MLCCFGNVEFVLSGVARVGLKSNRAAAMGRLEPAVRLNGVLHLDIHASAQERRVIKDLQSNRLET